MSSACLRLIVHSLHTIIQYMIDVGKFIRSLRTSRKWTLRDLSQRCNLSVSFLSQVERGLSSLTITSLDAICEALGVSLSDLFSKYADSEIDPSLLAESPEIVKATDRPYIQMSSASIKYQFLSGQFPERLFEILIGEIPPSYHYPPVVHKGEEFGFVLEGRLTLKVGEESYELGPGDSYHFLATVPHGYETDEQGTARILWVQTLKYSGLPVGMRKKSVHAVQGAESGQGTNAE